MKGQAILSSLLNLAKITSVASCDSAYVHSHVVFWDKSIFIFLPPTLLQTHFTYHWVACLVSLHQSHCMTWQSNSADMTWHNLPSDFSAEKVKITKSVIIFINRFLFSIIWGKHYETNPQKLVSKALVKETNTQGLVFFKTLANILAIFLLLKDINFQISYINSKNELTFFITKKMHAESIRTYLLLNIDYTLPL